ncbi:MAG: hypothetical protein XD69_0170 [Clostridia bacterium 62_21]|nr:MAG: hypothetical protein XD69_0170 [Clostridia bacterium 62_21]
MIRFLKCYGRLVPPVLAAVCLVVVLVVKVF